MPQTEVLANDTDNQATAEWHENPQKNPVAQEQQHRAAAYGMLAALFYRACRVTWPGRLSPAQLLAISVCFATLFGVSDEIHQSFVAARQADAMDGVADFAGSVLGALAYMGLTSRGGRCFLSRTGRRR